MNVLLISGTADLYGANRVFLEVISMLSPRHMVVILPSHGPLIEAVKVRGIANITILIENDIPVIGRNMRSPKGVVKVAMRMIRFQDKLKKIIDNFKIDWAYINTLSCILPLKLIRNLGIETILHVHEMLENDRILTKCINKYSLLWSNLIIAVSSPVRDNLLQVNSDACLANKVVTVLNGISDKYSPSNYINKRNTDLITITLFGRIIPGKGIWFFLDTVKSMKPVLISKCLFQVIGGPAPGGDYFVNQLHNDIKNHPFAEYIRFIPFISDIVQLLNESDVIVVPSLIRDSFPTTAIEGLSAGKPVIATNTGGTIQAILDGKTGFLINPNDVNAFREKLERLIEDTKLRREMGQAARNWYLSNFTLETFRRNLLKEITLFEGSLN